MKKQILLILLLIPIFGISQSLLDSIQAKIEEKIQHLNQTNVPSNILYERTFQKANLTAFSPPTLIIGQQFSESQSALPTPTSNNFHFFMALDDLKRSDYLNRFNDVESLYQTNKNSGNTVNIGILNVDFAVFNGDPLATGALYVAGTDSLLYENSNSSVPLYKKIENSFVASPLKKDFKSKTVTFKLHSSFWKETAQYQITNLQIDFNDGQGYRTVNKGQSVTISYPTYGEKLIKFKATFSNNKTQTTNAKFEIVNASSKIEVQTNSTEGTNSCYMPTSGYFYSTLTFQGYDESQAYAGLGRYQNHSGTNCVDKPVIVVEGYDPVDSNTNLKIFNNYLNVNNLGTQLVNSGYDVFTLDFQNYTTSNGKKIRGGSDYIERNAMVLIELINRINANKAENAEPIKIIGFSMGGLVARYALRYMELHNMNHDTDLYVSVDAPHQGAVVPSGAQYTMDFIDDLVPGWLNEEYDDLTDDLFLPAPKQMLVNHYGSGSEYPIGIQGFHDRFYNDLNAMGYPQQSRNIAVTNGRLDGIGTNEINQKYYEGKLHLFWVLLNGKLRLNLTHHDARARVFYWRLKFLGITVWKRERHANSYAYLGSYENTPGGISSVDDLDDRILKFTEWGFDGFVMGVKQNLASDAFSFLPTKSALDYQGNQYLFEDISGRNLTCSNTPFDSYFAPNQNENHTFLSTGASNFIWQEILGNPQTPSFILTDEDLKQQGTNLCGNNNVRLYFESCNVKEGTTWSVSDPSKIIISQQDASQIVFSAASNAFGSVIITAHIPGQNSISREVWIGKARVFVELESDMGGISNWAKGYLKGINSTLNQQEISYIHWEKLSATSGGNMYASDNDTEVNGQGPNNYWTVNARVHVTNPCGITQHDFVLTPPPCPPSGYIIEPSDDDTYTLRPIPCDEVFNKNNQETVYSQTINVFDYNGNLMFTTKGDNVNVKNLKPGIYFIKATINNEIITKKIIKK